MRVGAQGRLFERLENERDRGTIFSCALCASVVSDSFRLLGCNRYLRRS